MELALDTRPDGNMLTLLWMMACSSCVSSLLSSCLKRSWDLHRSKMCYIEKACPKSAVYVSTSNDIPVRRNGIAAFSKQCCQTCLSLLPTRSSTILFALLCSHTQHFLYRSTQIACQRRSMLL